MCTSNSVTTYAHCPCMSYLKKDSLILDPWSLASNALVSQYRGAYRALFIMHTYDDFAHVSHGMKKRMM